MNSLTFDQTIAIALLLLIFLSFVNIFTLGFIIFKRKEWSTKRFILVIIGTLIFNVLIIASGAGFITKGLDNEIPRIVTTYPETETVWENYNRPLEVTFNTPVQIDKLDPSINPDLLGTWQWEEYLGIPGITKKGYFTPSETIFEGQRIVVYITGIARPGYEENHEFGYVFESASLPTITYSTPFNQSNDLPVNSDIQLFFNKENIGNADWKYTFEPEVSFAVQDISDTSVLIDIQEELLQSQEYKLTVERRAARINLATKEIIESNNYETVADMSFYTVREPLIRSFSPNGTGIKQDSSIRIRFETPMDTTIVEEKLTITPVIQGDFSWNEDLTILTITPTTVLPKETKFTFTFAEGLMNLNGGISETAVTYEFETIGEIRIKSTTPQNDEVKVRENTTIRIQFDQEVDKESAQSKFSISPGVGGTFEWENDSTMIFKPNSQLNFNTTYTVQLSEGVKSIFGIDTRSPYSFSFTVRSNQVLITIPQYFQPQSPPSFSCNVYAARMALAWKGYNVDIISLIAEMGYNDSYENGQWLGNPYEEYVGTFDGGWGYGVYWGPIQQLFTNRGIQTQLNQGWNLSGVAQSIENGAPVVIWRYNGESANFDKNWTAADGTFIVGINGQHGSVVSGFRGTSDNPTHFYLNDPWYGQFWIEASLLDYYWSRLGRVGLAVQ